jgi:CRP-like cAMP-binding protein
MELSDADIDWFLKRSKFVEYKKNILLFQHGDEADYLYVIMEGWVKVFRDNADGEQTVQALLTRGDSFGEECVVNNRSYPCSAQVVGRNTVCILIPASTIRERLKDHPEIALHMLSSLADQLNKAGYLLELSSKLTAAQRVAAFLLKLCLDRGGVNKVKLPFNKFLVAERLGMKPETFSRTMRRLEQDLDIQFKGREVTINDLDDLQDYCEVFCTKEFECTLQEKLLCTKSDCDICRILKLM